MLSDLQKDKLQIILEDTALMGAWRTLFDSVIAKHQPEVTDGDTVMGQNYRAYKTAESIVASAFHEAEGYRKPRGEDRSFDPR